MSESIVISVLVSLPPLVTEGITGRKSGEFYVDCFCFFMEKGLHSTGHNMEMAAYSCPIGMYSNIILSESRIPVNYDVRMSSQGKLWDKVVNRCPSWLRQLLGPIIKIIHIVYPSVKQ